MARPVPGYLGYDVAADRPLVKLVAGTKRLLTEDDASGGTIESISSDPDSPIVVTDGSGPNTSLYFDNAEIESGGSQPLNVDGLEGILADPQTVEVSKDGSVEGTRKEINFIDGAGISTTVADNPGSARVDVTIAATGSATGNPYIDPPSSANAFDDEFLAGSDPDLANRGYTVKTSGGTTLTRGGDIAPWDTTGPTGNTYWSTIIGSWLLFQGPASTTVYIYKSISLSVGDCYFARMSYSGFVHNSGSNAKFAETGFYASSGGNLDLTHRVYVSDYETSGAPHQLDIGANNTAFAGITRNRWFDADIRGVRYTQSTANYNAFALNASSGEGVSLPLNSSVTASTVAFFAVGFTSGVAGTTPNVGSIDFIRKKTGGAWIIP